jgi:hypothetical protein
VQFHGIADRYTLSGAVAMLYSNATTATTNPAVTVRKVASGTRQPSPRPGESVIYAPGEPGVVGTGSRRHDADPSDIPG